MNRLQLQTMTIGNRIRHRMKELGLRPRDLIAYTGASKGTVSQWINDIAAPSARYIVKLCEALQCSESWLLHNNGDVGNVSRAKYAQGMVPVISKITAGNWKNQDDGFQPGDAEEFLPCPRKHSRHTYALKVEGDSMTSPHGRSFPDGCFIYCDPERVSGVVSGDLVVAKLAGEDEVTFKRYVKDAGKQYLRPLNSSYPTIQDEFRILAKVIGAWVDI